MTGLVLGMAIGLLLGTSHGSFFGGVLGHKDLLFYNEIISNNVICNRPAKQTFKCQVYKGGELVSSTVV